jgi:hypothetical protein
VRFRIMCAFFLWSLLSLAILLGTAATPAFAQGSPLLRKKAAEVDRVISKANAPGGVRVIVTLRGATPDPAQQPLPSASALQPSARAVSGPLGDGQPATLEQAAILARHVSSDVTKRQRWAPRLIRDTPYMAMTVDLAELEALAADSDVVSIHETAELELGLADSAPLIGMPAAYNLAATGQHFGVAILDSGVEFGHRFLGSGSRVTETTCFSTADANFDTLCPNGQNFQAGEPGIASFANNNLNKVSETVWRVYRDRSASA